MSDATTRHAGATMPWRPTRLTVAVSLASAGLGTWEVGLTRLAGLLYTRTLAYQALAVALLALGLGAWWASRRRRDATAMARSALRWLAPVLLLGAAACCWLDLAWALGAFAWPFAVFGVALTGAWRACRAGGERARRQQYRWELSGAAVGLAVLGPLSVAWAGSLAAAWLGAALCAAAAMWANLEPPLEPDADTSPAAVVGRGGRVGLVGTLLGCLAALAATAVGHPPLRAPLLAGPGIGIHLRHVAAREGAVEVETDFSAWARTDWLRARASDLSWIFVEGRFVARSAGWDGHSRTFSSRRVAHLARLKRIPWRVRAGATRALIVGAGAGFDAAVALQEQLPDGPRVHVTALEINPATVAFTRRDGLRNGQIYDRPEVTVVVAEARRWLTTQSTQFDQIQLSLMDTAPGGVRGRATAHNRLFTVEAMQLWRAHLRPAGMLVLLFSQTEDWQQATRQLAAMHSASPTGLNAGERSWRDHVWAASVPDADPRDDPFSHLLLYSATPWSAAERAQLARLAEAAGAVPATRQALARVTPAGDAASDAVLTDDRPARPRFGQSSIELTLAALALFLAVGLGGKRGRTARPRYAAAIAGLAITWVQVSLVEWFSAATGAPALALGATIAAMLLGAAAGSALTWRGRGAIAAALSAAAIALGGPTLANAATVLPLPMATLLLAAAVLLLSLPLGMPWITAMAVSADDSAGGEGRIVAADGLGAVIGAGTSGVLVQAVGLRGSAAAAVIAMLVVAVLLRNLGGAAASHADVA